MAAIKDKDFVELEYTGKTKEDNIVFDTTDEKTAKDSSIYSKQMTYGPLIICVGTGSILKGLEDNLVGKEPGSYSISLSVENAFGKKNAKLLKIVNTNVFRKSDINPMPGLQVNIDGMPGTIRSITGGRTVVDFNHPLSGKEIVYEVKLMRIIVDDKEKISSFISLNFNLKPDAFTVAIDPDNKASVEFKEGVKMKHFDTGKMAESLKELVGINDIVFKAAEAKKSGLSTQK
jgi:FKBP-type peptidyl-prolyl cis-trans isomerase 2